MALQTELCAHGIAPSAARGLGSDAPVSSLTATGTNQATALALASSLSLFGTVGSGTGALLPLAINKSTYAIYNGGSNALTVYPNGSETINGTTSFSVTNGKSAVFIPMGQSWIANLSA